MIASMVSENPSSETGKDKKRPVIEVQSVCRAYKLDEEDFYALKDVNLLISEGEFVAIMGQSGSGKSSLMYLLGALDRPTEGAVLIDGENIAKLSQNKLAELRNRKIGFVFQSFNLIPRMSALKSVELPLSYMGVKRSERKSRAIQALESVGLGNRLHHRPNQLSGGQQQRVAIARALVVDPAIVLADEPTGNLDSASGDEVMRILADLNEKHGKTVVLVTHEPTVAAYARRTVRILDGRIVSDTTNDIKIDSQAPFASATEVDSK